MKYFKLSILLTVIGLGIFFANNVFATTEFVSIIDPDNGAGTDYTSLSTWEQAIQSDLSDTTATLVFSYTTASGTIPDLATVQGETSGATATSTHMASSSNQILLTNISGIFQAGETIYIQGQATSSNYIISDNNGDSVIAVAKCRSTGGSPDTTAVTIDGWTTSVDNYIKVWTDPDDSYGRHNGKWDDNKYRIDTSSHGITIAEDYINIIGLQIESNGDNGIVTDNNVSITDSIININNNIIKWSGSSASSLYGIYFPYGKTIKIYNNIIYNINSTGINSASIGFNNSALIGYVYNNTTYNCLNGFYANSGIIISKNNIIQNCTTNFLGTFSNDSTNNISDDATHASSTADIINTEVVFIDATNNDFHLSPTDTSAKNAGTDLSSDPNLPFTDDIDGTARGGAWDIGADEVPVEYVSTICENTSAGGDCANMDYSHLGGTGNWEDKVECDLTANTTRVFLGTITGTLNENATVNLCNGSTDLNIDGVVVATTSDQILIDNITGTTTPLVATNGWLWSDEACDSAANYWTISGIGDDLGASPIAVAMIDGDWSVADENAVTIEGWTTDNDNYIKVYTTDLARHQGKWNDEKYRLTAVANNDYFEAVDIREENVKIIGLQVSIESSSYTSGIGLYSQPSTHNSSIIISHNIVKGILTNNAEVRGIFIHWYTNDAKIFNNIVYDFFTNNSYGIHGESYNVKTKIFNNTVYNSYIGIYTSYHDSIVKNNLVASTTNPFGGEFDSTSDYNATDIDDTPGGGGSNNATSSTFTFVDAANNDFHLAQTDVGAQSQGTDLSSDANLNFVTDIDGGTRIGSWDIGADQLSEKIYRSVGNDSSDLNTDSRTVTISGTTATFSDTMPDNIGVGDIIQYGGAGYYQIAVISGRSSSTEYTVQSYDLSSSLSATTTASASVYRAHLTLNDWETQTLENVNSGISDDIDDYVLVGQDLVASNTIMMTACYASDNGDEERVGINGWITGVDNYIKVYTPVESDEVGVTQRHRGKWDDDKYKLVASDWNIVEIQEDFIWINGLQISSNSANTRVFIYNSMGSNSKIFNNIIKRTVIGNNNSIGISCRDVGGTNIWNNTIYDMSSSGSQDYGIRLEYNVAIRVYNNTVINCDNRGITISGANTDVKNNLAIDNGEDFGVYDSWGSGCGYNISGDGTAPGLNSKINTAVKFIDEANHDFHLSPTDTSAIDAGVNLSTSTDLSFFDDIDGNYRRQWDIGADEASVYFDSTIMESGGEFSSLSAWETANQVNLTATTTATFSIASSTGSIPVGSSVTGATSGATASTTVVATSSNKILLYNISGTFISGEDVQLDGATSNAVELSNAGNPAIAVAKIDGAWSIADETAVEINGWTTGEYNYVKVYTTDSARHNGKWDEGRYRLERDADGMWINEDYVYIDGLQFQLTENASTKNLLRTGDLSLSNKISVSNCIFKGILLGDSNHYALYFSDSDGTYYVWNNIIYDFDINSSYGINCAGAGGVYYIYNNTLVNCDIGLRGRAGTRAKNNIVQDCTTGFSGTFNSNSTNNLSDDATYASSTADILNTEVTFVDEANNDFHLSPTDTSAKNAGTNLSSDSNLPFTDDIDGNTRYDVAWDIGADETTTILYRSVGNDTNDLNINTATTTISITTAEFSIDMPAKIGVGDVLQYGFPLQLGFITARTSSTTYEIQNRTGALPTATTSASVSIFRAHEFLDDWEDQLVADVNDGIDESVDDLVLINNMDLTASNTAMFVSCYASTSADNLAVEINDWTTATSNYIKIYTPVSFLEVGESQRHSGIWDDEKYMLNISNDTCFNIQEPYTEIEGLQLTTSGTDVALTTYYSSAADYVKIYYNILKSTSVSTGNGMEFGPDRTSFEIYNNIVYDFPDSCIEAQDFGYVYNNTVMNCDVGFLGMWTANAILKNNVAFNNVDDFSSSFDILDYNASDDLDGTNAIDISPCPVEEDCWKGMFVDYENYDFRIKNANSVLYNSGTTISNVTDDILGIARPQHGIYDVGAFEYSNSTPKYKFNGGKFKLKGKFKFK